MDSGRRLSKYETLQMAQQYIACLKEILGDNDDSDEKQTPEKQLRNWLILITMSSHTLSFVLCRKLCTSMGIPIFAYRSVCVCLFTSHAEWIFHISLFFLVLNGYVEVTSMLSRKKTAFTNEAFIFWRTTLFEMPEWLRVQPGINFCVLHQLLTFLRLSIQKTKPQFDASDYLRKFLKRWIVQKTYQLSLNALQDQEKLVSKG